MSQKLLFWFLLSTALVFCSPSWAGEIDLFDSHLKLDGIGVESDDLEDGIDDGSWKKRNRKRSRPSSNRAPDRLEDPLEPDEPTEPEEPEEPYDYRYSIRISLVLTTLRGQAFEFNENNFSYDNATDIGIGGEVEFAASFWRDWFLYFSLELTNFGEESSNFSNNKTLATADFQGYRLINVRFGGKYFPFVNQEGLMPYIKFGIGVTNTPDLEFEFNGTTQTPLSARTRFGMEFGIGIEYRYVGESVEFAIVVESMVLNLVEQSGKPLSGEDNMYIFPVKMGLAFYF